MGDGFLVAVVMDRRYRAGGKESVTLRFPSGVECDLLHGMPSSESLEEIIRKGVPAFEGLHADDHRCQRRGGVSLFQGGRVDRGQLRGALGQEALAQIVGWKLEERTVAPLPLGIKRSLWDQIEILLNPGMTATASGKLPKLPAFSTEKKGPSSPFDRYKAIAGLLKLLLIGRKKTTVIFEDTANKTAEPENVEWLNEFAERVKSVGDTLGFGGSEKWTIDTERYQVVGLSHDDGFITLLRRKDTYQDDLEAAVERGHRLREIFLWQRNSRMRCGR